MTFKICAVLGAQGIRATGFRRAQGNQHCAKFESHSNRVTFETNAISVISSVHPIEKKYLNLAQNFSGPNLHCNTNIIRDILNTFFFSLNVDPYLIADD